MRIGTKEYNPLKRSGQSGYSVCSMCGLVYTHLGIARHWGKCKRKGECYKREQGICQCTGECQMQGKRAKYR